MTAAKQDDQFGGHGNLAEALAAFQAEMPTVGKNSRNNFGSYADLADVAKEGHPVLARHGLSFSSKPTLNADGVFVLAYVLRHTSGQEDSGEFPLPAASTMQAIGGSVTYARRYALCAVTGLVADEDTDAQDNAKVDTGAARQAKQQRPAAQQAKPAGPSPSDLRQTLAGIAKAKGTSYEKLGALYLDGTKRDLDGENDPAKIQQFIDAIHDGRVPVAADETAKASS